MSCGDLRFTLKDSRADTRGGTTVNAVRVIGTDALPEAQMIQRLVPIGSEHALSVNALDERSSSKLTITSSMINGSEVRLLASSSASPVRHGIILIHGGLRDGRRGAGSRWRGLAR